MLITVTVVDQNGKILDRVNCNAERDEIEDGYVTVKWRGLERGASKKDGRWVAHVDTENY